MGTLADHPSSKILKTLFIGDSGMGKTGAHVALVEAGYKLYILDFDNGLDIIANELRNKGKANLLSQVSYETLTDGMRITAGNMIPMATAWSKSIKTLNEWKLETLGEMDIIVVDSLTFAGKSALKFVQNLQGRLADQPQIQDFLTAQGLLERLCATLYSDAVKCNVIVTSHVREVARTSTQLDSRGRPVEIEEEGSRKGYPETGAGKALSPVVGRYFNSVILADIMGSGPSARRIIRTVPHGNIGLKNSAPGKVKPEYPLATGLAQFFADVRGQTTGVPKNG